MAKNYILRRRTQERIDERVERLLNRLGNPEPVRRRMIWNRRRDFGLEGSGSVG